MILDRLETLKQRLTDRTVFAELLAPVQRALPFVRKGDSLGSVLCLKDFIALGVLRYLQGMTTLREQVKRQRANLDAPDGTDRPDWAAPVFRYTSKVSRQVLRFLKHCFLKPASPALYRRELRPMLVAYL